MIDDDDEAGPGPLPPEDRLWRHPSELARAAAGPAAAGPTGRRSRPLVVVGVLSGLAGAAVTVVSLAALGAFTAPTALVERDATGSTGPPTTAVRSAAAIATSVAPAVVEVTATVGDEVRHGSGVVARSDGLVLTSAQLVAGATAVGVTWPSGRREEASLEGRDPMTGLAAITVAGTGYPTATLDITPPRPGDQTITVSARSGSSAPLVVEGTVSATGTHVADGDALLVGLIETDHPVPAGADGGALVDRDGHLRGICVALTDPTGTGPAETGWAVPAEVALRVADDLRRLGRVDRGWLGIAGAPVADAGAVPAGFAVDEVMAGSPAEQAGLAAGDVVLAVDDQRVRSLADVQAALTLTRPGQAVALEVNRADQTLEVEATLVPTPS
ncbi:PDZ domain-containing protein [Iamia sp. SCSIO 61187]|uniref:S1C family serine protease n=1 Tax=Iamia sp. SCSIO 61187 TaxID=2722752 RepID=UPI002105CC6E|nr:trypsin-like peptidase domain-containing protein [Iamia sp. SCSIO 61187]QYG91374.1 PDZ domain-containing protein [Iamia sp. SCSIO 61187]